MYQFDELFHLSIFILELILCKTKIKHLFLAIFIVHITSTLFIRSLLSDSVYCSEQLGQLILLLELVVS